MASNFAFYPQSITTLFTVAANTITFSMSLQLQTGTGTLALAGGNYQVSGARIANTGTSNAQILFSAASGSPVLTASNGFPVLANTVETFRCQGLPVVQMLCLTGSTTVWITCGEGL